MSEPEFVDVASLPLVADESWYHLQQRQNGSGPDEPSDWEPRLLSDVSDAPPEPPTLGGLNLLYPGKRHVFSGPQESAKTLAAYVVALSVVREGGRVLVIDFEMGERDAKTRMRELGAEEDELRSLEYLEPVSKLTPEIAEGLASRDLQLVIVDATAGAYQLQGFDDNKRSDVEHFAALYVRPFWRNGIATLLLDHVVKNLDARGAYAIGSERKVGQTDVHLGFSTILPIKRGSQGKYQITTHKDRGGFHKRGKLAVFALESHPETHRFTWAFETPPEVDEEHPFRPTVKMEQASRWLEKQMEEGVPMSHIEEGIGGDRAAGRLAIQILVDEGFVREEKGPRNARLMTLVRPYREEFDDLSVTSPHLSGELAQNDLSGSPPPYKGGELGGVVNWTGEVSSPDKDDIPF